MTENHLTHHIASRNLTLMYTLGKKTLYKKCIHKMTKIYDTIYCYMQQLIVICQAKVTVP